MKFSVFITTKAQNDLEEIFLYIHDVLSAPQSAKSIYNDIKNKINSLSQMPERFRECIEGENIRSVNVRHFQIIYNVTQEIVYILRIFYSRSDIKNKLNEIKETID